MSLQIKRFNTLIVSTNLTKSSPPAKKPRFNAILFEREQFKAIRGDGNADENFTRLSRELDDYLRDEPAENDELEWWRQNQKNYPHLVQLALKYLCIPASSTPSERIFSKAGLVLSEKRTRQSRGSFDIFKQKLVKIKLVLK